MIRQCSVAASSSLSAPEFAEHLSRDWRELGHDRHFRVFYDPEFREEVARLGFGLEIMRRLPGNIADLELRGFALPDLVGPG